MMWFGRLWPRQCYLLLGPGPSGTSSKHCLQQIFSTLVIHVRSILRMKCPVISNALTVVKSHNVLCQIEKVSKQNIFNTLDIHVKYVT